jgi:hypothetical protein
MDIPSITILTTKCSTLSEEVDKLNLNDHKEIRFGSEKEYTYKGMIGGIKALIVDILALCNQPEKLLTISTKNERDSIAVSINNIIGSIKEPTNLYHYIDALKVEIRPFKNRYSKVRTDEFGKSLEKLQQKEIEINSLLSEVKKLEITANDFLSQIKNNLSEINSTELSFNDSSVKLKTLIAKVNSEISAIEEKILNLTKIEILASEKSALIAVSHDEVKSNEKVIAGFADRVQSLQQQMDATNAATIDYTKKLANYTKERTDILQNAEKLIESAKQALSYKTAEGISASFQTQYEAEKSSHPFSWMWATFTCIAVSILIGVWIMYDFHKELYIIIGRVTLLPLPIALGVFCANQYVKRYNILQDYGYKMVLAKSLVGFSEQLKKEGSVNSEEYTNYITKVLDQIHQDPLRSRSGQSSYHLDKKLSDVNGLISKLNEIVGKFSPEKNNL